MMQPTLSTEFDTPACERHPRPIPGRWVAYGLVVMIVAFVTVMWRAGLSVDPTAPSCRPFYLIGALALGLRLGLDRGATRFQRIVRDAAEFYGIFTLMVLTGAIACYPVAAISHGFVDGALDRADAALGFDWVTWYDVVAAHPILQVAGRAIYDSIYFSPAAILAHYALTGRRDRAYAFFATFWLAAVITLILYWFMPAVGPLSYRVHGPLPYMPLSELWQPQLIPALRERTVHLVDVGHLRGLVSAPSFHAAAAVLFMAAAWPLTRLRWPILIVNSLMLLSTPVEGTHYLTDLLLGAAVAMFSILVIGRVGAWRTRRHDPVLARSSALAAGQA